MAAAAFLPSIGLLFDNLPVLLAEQGSYAVSGQDAGVSWSEEPHSTPAPLPHLGLLEGLGGDTGISERGLYSVTGQDATFLIGYRVIADAGFYTNSGQPSILNVSVNQGGDAAYLPHIGSLLRNTSGSVTLTADTGIYSFTGSESLSDFEVNIAQGSYGFTGQDADLRKTAILVAESGSYAVSGQDADFQIGSPARTLTAEQGTYSLAGQDASLVSGYRTPAEHGFYALLGQAANLSVGATNNYVMLAEVGLYDHLGQDAELIPGDPVLACEYGEYLVSGINTSSPDNRRRVGVPNKARRNYTYKGKRYLQLTNDELAKLIARDLIDISREDIQVTYKGQKPHKVSKQVFDGLIDTASKLKPEESTDDQDIEDIIALL